MTSLKGTALVVLIMTFLIPIVSWVVSRAVELEAAGADLSLPWRVTLAATNWYVRLLPFIAIGAVALAAAVGGFMSKGTSVSEERRVLFAWLILSVVAFVLPLGLSRLAPHLTGTWWTQVLMLVIAVAMVAPVAAVVVAVHLQSRIQKQLMSKVRAWHIAGTALLLALLGPAALIPPAWVWARPGKARPESE